MQFDLADIDTKERAEAGADMRVRRVDGSPLLARNGQPVTIRLLGSDSSKYETALQMNARRRIAANAAASAAGQPITVTENDIKRAREDALDILAACTVSWENVFDTEGNPVDCTAEAARALYAGFPVIRDQAESFVASRSNFLTASSSN